MSDPSLVRRPVLLRWLVPGAFVLAALAGCGPHTDEAAEPQDPVALSKVPGTELTRLVVEPDAVSTIGISTADVSAFAGAAELRGFPSAALMYGPDGAPFVYVNSEENTYDRHPVTVDHVDGDVAVVREGPVQGTPVVTQGAAELVGMEFGLEDE
jgi:multidrug efflux pump subunit AcrA (membrane-fusion protein)